MPDPSRQEDDAGLAILQYGTPDYHVVRPGRFVRCAGSGVRIPLTQLKYWSVALQEAYATPDIATERWLASRGRKRGE